MKDKIRVFFEGRNGMDEMSKFLFWSGILSIILSGIAGGFLKGIPAVIFRWFGIYSIIMCFFRALSKNIAAMERQNYAFLALIQKRKEENAHRKERFALRKEYRFYKCPGCGIIIRVPRGKGKIHIKCKCGYTLYRKT